MNGLYEITPHADVIASDGPNNGGFEVRVVADHVVFSGHFPGNPVLPGVCSMMIVRECASRVAGRPLRYATIAECKFTAAIAPGDLLEVWLRLTADEDGLFALTATILTGGAAAVKLKARLTADE